MVAESVIPATTPDAENRKEGIKMKVELRHLILAVLAREGVSSPSRIAEEVGVTRQAVLNSLNRLLKRGWVERVDRGVYVATEEGKRVVEKMALV